MMPILYLLVFLFGLAVGSFLNSVIHRLHTGEKIVFTPPLHTRKGLERSYCPNCGHKLSWQDLIPLLSYIFLRGRCRYCKQPISIQYPLVELATGIVFVAFFHLQFSFFDSRFWMLGQQASLFWFWHLFYWFFIASALIVIFVYDLKHFLIPDKIIYPVIGIAFLNRLLEVASVSYRTYFGISNFEFAPSIARGTLSLSKGVILHFDKIATPFAAALIASAFFLAIVLVSRGRWMGFGDVKLAFLMGLFLGFPNIVTALFLAFFFGALVGIVLVLAKRKTMKSEVPFGPFLVTATFLALFWGQKILDWYFGLSL